MLCTLWAAIQHAKALGERLVVYRTVWLSFTNQGFPCLMTFHPTTYSF